MKVQSNFVKKIKSFIKNETVFVIATLFAVGSMFFVKPSRAYFDYIDFSVLALLFCLMAVVAGLGRIGVFDWLSFNILKKNNNTKAVSIMLVCLCFFSAMLITNDVALITFVPLTISIYKNGKEGRTIFLIVMETVAANLGSLVTPVGNPQNLFLYSFYSMNIPQFFKTTLPLGAVCFVLIMSVMLFITGETLETKSEMQTVKINRVRLAEYIILFILCILVVLKVLDYRICFAVVLSALLLTDRKALKKVDYILLLTFVSFFVFVGNIGNIDAVKETVSKLISGRELIGSVLLSQIISNVPAAVMLSSFTQKSKDLLIGVNIGGLGTVVASLASLISYKLYCETEKAQKGKYMLIFSAVNFSFLAVLIIGCEIFI